MVQLKHIFSVLVLILLNITGHTGSAQLPNFSFETITTKEGLPSNTVLFAGKDKKGFMWFGTRRCPARYDGTTFKNFLGMETNFVSGLAADSSNNIWAATDRSGVCKIDATTFQMKIVPKAHQKPSNQTGHFFIDSYHQGWYSDWYGINRINLQTGKSVHYPFRQTTYVWVKASFVEDQQQNLWVIGSDNGLFRYDRKNDKLIGVLGADAQDPQRRTPLVFSQACVDTNNILWIGTHNAGLVRYDLQSGKYEKYATGNALLSVEEGVDENGRQILWIGDNEGLSIFRPDQKQFYRFTGLFPEAFRVNYIFRDKQEGIVWICTSEGILKYHPKSNLFQTIPIPAGIVRFPVTVNKFLQDKCDPSGETFWLGLSHTGMLRWNRQTDEFTLIAFPPKESAPDIRWMLQGDDGIIWIGVNQWSYKRPGIFVFDPKKKQFLQTPLSQVANRYFSVPFFMYGFFEGQNRLWIGNSDEGFRVIDSKQYNEVTPWDSLSQYNLLLKNNNLINDMIIDRRGRVWLATYQGIYYLDQQGHKFINVDLINPAVQIEDPAVNTLFEDSKGNIWAARWGSVTQSDPDGVLQMALTVKDGLYDRENRGMAEDESGNIWIGNYEGLHCYNPQTKRLLRFTQNDGLLSNNTLGRLFIHNGKELFIGQKNGINLLQVEKLKGQNVPPGIEISSFKVHDKEQYLDFSKPIRLKRTDNAFSVDFVALNYTKLQNNQYAYYLEGFDKKWNYSGQNHLAYYTNLDPDHYTLHLRAGDALGNWNQQTLRLNITILPAFYETWWFRAFIFVVIIGILYAFYRYRINQLLRLQQVRNRISADLHDEIGSSLSGISIMGMIAKNNLQVQHPSSPFLERIVEETHQISSSLDDIVWSINPKNDDLSNLIARMTRYASELLEARGIEYTMHIPEHFGLVKLSMEQRRDFYLIFKEAVNNLVKYAQCTNASVKISMHRQILQLEIRDNGVGFDPAAYTERNGLRNLKKRAVNLKGNLSIQSSPGNGTTIRLTFPV